MSQGTTPAGFERRLDARLVLSVVATAVMSFSGVCVETAMNVTFPTLMEEFGISTSTVQWMTTSYLLVLAAVVPTSSYLNRRFRTRSVFVAAMCFYVSGIVCGLLAVSFPMLIVGRVLEGVGTGIALPLMFNVITEQAPLENLGVMTGVGTLVTALAPAVGPSVGGWLAETFGWRAIFGALLPVLVVAFALGAATIRQSHEVSRDPFDWGGWACLALCFAALVFAVDLGLSQGAGGVVLWGCLAASVVLLALFVFHERRCERPLIHLSVFGAGRFDLGVVALVALQFCVLGLSFLIPNYAQLVGGAGETEAGSILLPGCLVGAVMAPLGGRVLDRLGARRPILAGAACALLACLLFACLGASGTLATGVTTSVYVLFAFGQSLMVGNTLTTSVSFLPAETKPDGNAVANTLQQLAGAVGTSVTSAMVNAAQAGAADMVAATAAGTESAYVLLAAVMVVPLACMCVATRGLAAPSGRQGR